MKVAHQTAKASWKCFLGLLTAAAAITGSVACQHPDAQTTVGNPFGNGMTFAVAPVLNFSGEMTVDPIKAADLLASELTYVQGANVLPVSRVVAYLAAQGCEQIESPAHALAVAEAVGADAIWIPAITEYDPYTPVVGLAIQVYAISSTRSIAIDPVQTERLARPISLQQMTDPALPLRQVQLVYNGTHANIADAVKKFAKPRSEGDSPLGWREYLKVQTLFLRFCWHDAIDRLMTSGVGECAPTTTDNEWENSL